MNLLLFVCRNKPNKFRIFRSFSTFTENLKFVWFVSTNQEETKKDKVHWVIPTSLSFISALMGAWFYTNINVLFCYIIHFICDPLLWEHVPRSAVTPRLWEWCDNTFFWSMINMLASLPLLSRRNYPPTYYRRIVSRLSAWMPLLSDGIRLGAQHNSLAWKLDH